MNYGIQEVMGALKSAREAKAWSQRDLGARAGLPQSHISKIESGKVDLQLSSLIQLARLLELEVKLVPKKALPAVDSVIRSTAPQTPDRETRNAIKRLREAESVVETLRRAEQPDSAELHRASTILRELRNFQYGLDDLQRLNRALKPYRELQQTLVTARLAAEAKGEIVSASEALGDLSIANRRLEELRRRLAHAPHRIPGGAKPAYDLEDDDA